MKKAVAFLLAAVLLLSLMTTTFAATPIISFGKATFTQQGEKQTLVIEGRDLDSVSVIQFTVKYDSTKVKLLNVAPDDSKDHFPGKVIGAADNGIIPDATVNGGIPGEVIVVWEYTEGIKADGILVELEFEALVKNAGEIKLELDTTEKFIVRKDGQNGLPTVDVEIETTDEPLVKYGDVDMDGEVTPMDATYVLRKAAELNVELDEVAADVDGDGEISPMDATYILRYSAELITKFPVESKNG